MPIGVYKRTKPAHPAWNKGKKNHYPAWNKGKKAPQSSEENHHNWKGDAVGYSAKHMWMSKKAGQPRYCEHCKRTNKKKYEWANKDHKYRRKITDYLRLCTSCHRKYDYENHLSDKGNRYGSTKNKS